MDLEEIRFYEIEFIELCFRAYRRRNSTADIVTFLKSTAPLIDTDYTVLTPLVYEIFSKRYLPDDFEITKFGKFKEIPVVTLQRALGITREGYYYRINKIKNKIIYPHCTEAQQKAIVKYMQQYDALYVPDYINNIILKGGEKDEV